MKGTVPRTRSRQIIAAAAVLGAIGGAGSLPAQRAGDIGQVARATPDTLQDSPARAGGSIIVAAIARNHALSGSLHDYQYQVASKLLVRDRDKPQDSAASVALISEARSDAYWQFPDRYQETIIARRRANHLSPLWNAVWSTVSVADVGNFQRDRIEILPYSFASPIADDALTFYDFRLLEILVIDGRRVFRLAMRPRSPTSPSLTGVIDIADSTYDVVAIDAGVTDAAQFGLWKTVRYREYFADQGDGRWLPSEVRLTGDARLRVRIPKTPQHLSFEQEARFSHFRFNAGELRRDLNEVRIVGDRQSEHADSATWSAPGMIPPSDAEQQVWHRRELAAQQPPGLISRVGQLASLSQVATASPDFFHFNRVDGAYVGAGWTFRPTSALTLSPKLGLATGSDRWQYRVGGDVQLIEASRLWLGASYHDETVTRPSLVPHAVDRTVDALLYRSDPLDYYREAGLTVSLAIRPLDFTRLELHYNDQEQTSLPVVTDYSVLRPSRAPLGNGFIVDGRMRSVSGGFTYDSRWLLRRNGQDSHLPSLAWTRITISAEVASPGLIRDDFNFGRFALQVERHQRTRGWGVTTINGLVGIATGTVPPQRYFTIDFGMRALGFQGGGFRTLGDTSFAGNRVAMLSIRHDFDPSLLAKSGLPLIRRLPFTLSVYGGAFAIGFAYHTPYPGDSAFRTTTSPYTEAGFIVGNLVPFLAPLNLGAQFTWQLSSQATRRFQFGLNLRGP
jgi:Family of unknown function (DUF5686)